MGLNPKYPQFTCRHVQESLCASVLPFIAFCHEGGISVDFSLFSSTSETYIYINEQLHCKFLWWSVRCTDLCHCVLAGANIA